jgi:hypothetical protein
MNVTDDDDKRQIVTMPQGSSSSSFTIDDEFLDELWSICNNDDDTLTNAVMMMDHGDADIEEGICDRHWQKEQSHHQPAPGTSFSSATQQEQQN